MFGFQGLIAPLDVDEFLEKSWGRAARHIPGAEAKFADLYGWEDVNHALSFGRPSYEGIRLVYEKTSLPPTELANLSRWLAQGATLIVNSVDQIDPIVGRFGSVLGLDLNTHVNINCYASCPARQGFDTHYDRHDVFIIQIAGTKRWTVFEPTTKWPLERQRNAKGKPPETEPYLDVELSPGDVLYIPRGHWHHAVAVTPSIHFTVGPESRSGVDFLYWITDRLMYSDEFLRQDFPVVGVSELGGTRDSTALREHVDTFRQHMKETLDREDLLESLVQYCMSSAWRRRSFQLPHHGLIADQVSPDTLFERLPDQKVLIRWDESTQRSLVLARGSILDLEKLPQPVLQRLFEDQNPVNGAMLISLAPQLEWKQVRTMLLLLYERRVLRLATPIV